MSSMANITDRTNPLNHHPEETYIVQSPGDCRSSHPINEKLGRVLPDGRYFVKVQGMWYGEEGESVWGEAFYAAEESLWNVLDGADPNIEMLDAEEYKEVLSLLTPINPARIETDSVFSDTLDERYDESLLSEMEVSRDDCLEGLALLQDGYSQSLDERQYDYSQYDRVTSDGLTILDLPSGNWASEGHEVAQRVLGESIEADVVREFHRVISWTHERVAQDCTGIDDTGGFRAVVVYDPTEALDLTPLHFSVLVNWAYRDWVSRRDLADRLNTSEATVKKYISRRKEKLAVARNTVELLEGIEATR